MKPCSSVNISKKTFSCFIIALFILIKAWDILLRKVDLALLGSSCHLLFIHNKATIRLFFTTCTYNCHIGWVERIRSQSWAICLTTRPLILALGGWTKLDLTHGWLKSAGAWLMINWSLNNYINNTGFFKEYEHFGE